MWPRLRGSHRIPGRARLRLTGCREPSPGPKRAGSWPFGLPSSRLRPCRAARSACIAPGQAVLGICNVRHRGIAVGPGDATAAIRICARLRKSSCSCPPPGQLYRSLWGQVGNLVWLISRSQSRASKKLQEAVESAELLAVE